MVASGAEGNNHERGQTQGSHAEAVDKLITNQVQGEDTFLETARWPLENV
jgi:hypothetical protein